MVFFGCHLFVGYICLFLVFEFCSLPIPLVSSLSAATAAAASSSSVLFSIEWPLLNLLLQPQTDIDSQRISASNSSPNVIDSSVESRNRIKFALHLTEDPCVQVHQFCNEVLEKYLEQNENTFKKKIKPQLLSKMKTNCRVEVMSQLYAYIMPSSFPSHVKNPGLSTITRDYFSSPSPSPPSSSSSSSADNKEKSTTTRGPNRFFASQNYLEIVYGSNQRSQGHGKNRSRENNSIWQGVLNLFAKENITLGKDIYCACSSSCNIDNLIEQLILDVDTRFRNESSKSEESVKGKGTQLPSKTISTKGYTPSKKEDSDSDSPRYSNTKVILETSMTMTKLFVSTLKASNAEMHGERFNLYRHYLDNIKDMHLIYTPYSPYFDPFELHPGQSIEISLDKKNKNLGLHPLHFPLVLLHHYMSIFHLVPITSQPYLVDQIGIIINHYMVPLLSLPSPNIDKNFHSPSASLSSSSALFSAEKSQKILSMLRKASRSFYAGMIVRQIWLQPNQRPSLGNFVYSTQPSLDTTTTTTTASPLSTTSKYNRERSSSLLAKPFWIWNDPKDSAVEPKLEHKIERGFRKPENIYTDLLLVKDSPLRNTTSNVPDFSLRFVEENSGKPHVSLDDIVLLIENNAHLIQKEIQPVRQCERFRSQLREERILVGEKEHLSSAYSNDNDEHVQNLQNFCESAVNSTLLNINIKKRKKRYGWEEIVLLKHGEFVNSSKLEDLFPHTVATIEKVNKFVEPYLEGKQIEEEEVGSVSSKNQNNGRKPKLLFNAKFSILYPNTIIHPHCGPSNKRLRMHLTLAGISSIKDSNNQSHNNSSKGYIVVGGIKNENIWASTAEGKVTVFDDSFEHKVIYTSSTTTSSNSAFSSDEIDGSNEWTQVLPQGLFGVSINDASQSFHSDRRDTYIKDRQRNESNFHQARIVLIMDIWHPNLPVRDWIYQ